MTDFRWDVDPLAFAHVWAAEHVLPEMTAEVFQYAATIAPVRTGRMRMSLWQDIGFDAEGSYGDVGAMFYGRFLDPKAVQLHRLHPFLPTSLEILNGRQF